MRTEEVLRKENNPCPVDYLGNLPNEVLQHVLSYLSFEETDGLRVVNRKFQSACNYLLSQSYRSIKQEVTLRHDSLLPVYKGEMLWIVMQQFLTNAFRLFDIFRGYLNVEYRVNGKTLDIMRQLLWSDGMKGPLYFLVQTLVQKLERNAAQFFLNSIPNLYRLDIMLIANPAYIGLPPRTDDEDERLLLIDALTTLWLEKTNMKSQLKELTVAINSVYRLHLVRMFPSSHFCGVQLQTYYVSRP